MPSGDSATPAVYHADHREKGVYLVYLVYLVFLVYMRLALGDVMNCFHRGTKQTKKTK